MNEEPKNQIKDLTKMQRRVLGVLMEKAFTTPDQYPLTLKAVTTACNQKSNRSPQVSYDEGQVQDALDQMREDLLVAEVFPGGGRTARYRHYMRNKFDFSEPQLAVIAELMLRGRQQPGELRTRASRMVRIESQEQLREELSSLQTKGYLQANGPLDRRGVEVDHTFYLDREGKSLGASDTADVVVESDSQAGSIPDSGESHESPAMQTSTSANEIGTLEKSVSQLQAVISEQAATIESLQSVLEGLENRLQKLERDLGV